MKDANLKIAKELTENKASGEADRVKERLKVLMAEEKEYMGQSSGSGQAGPKSASTSQQKASQSK